MLKKICSHFEEILGSIVLAVMAVVTVANVFTRYVITYPLAFTEEITVNLFVWLVMLGASIGFRQNAHLAMSFFYDLLPHSAKKVCFYIGNALSILFFILMTWLGTVQVLEELELGVTTDALAIPAACYSVAVPLFSVLIIVRILQSTRTIAREGKY